MPSKSRRNRRNITQNRPNRATTVSTVSSEPMKPVSARAVSPPAAKPDKVINPSRNAPATPIYPNIGTEIKWISVVAVVIIAIMIVLYFTVREKNGTGDRKS